MAEMSNPSAKYILYGVAPALKAWLAFVLNNPSSDARIGPLHYSPPCMFANELRRPLASDFLGLYLFEAFSRNGQFAVKW